MEHALFGVLRKWRYVEAGHNKGPCDNVAVRQRGQPIRQLHRDIIQEYTQHMKSGTGVTQNTLQQPNNKERHG